MSNQSNLERQKENSENEIMFPCDCGDISHIARLSMDRDIIEGHPDIVNGYLQMLLNHQPNLLKRICIAVLYIFKKDSTYWTYDSIILNEYQLKQLKDFLNSKV